MIYYLSLKDETPCKDYWDYGILDLLDYPSEEVRSLPKVDKAIVVLPARHHAGLEDEVNGQLRRISKVVLFLMGDEDAEFDTSKIKHGDIQIWKQNPHKGIHDQYHKLGTGYTTKTRQILKNASHTKRKTVFFAGQITHQRREELERVLVGYKQNGGSVDFNPSKGFTQGLDHETYYRGMASAYIAPAPSGAVIPDSFRLFEALESMAVPIADERCANGKIYEYWDWLFGEAVPFPKVVDWDRLPSITAEIMEDYPYHQHHITAFWLQWKYNFRHKVREQLGLPPEKVTVIIPTSVLQSHPSTDIIDETIRAIRKQLPNADIIMQIDGLREEQEDRRKDYDRYKTEVLWKCLHEWDKVTPVVFDELHHQTDMLRATIDMVKTPMMIYVEGDAPLTPDEIIEWDLCYEMIETGQANTIRFHHEAQIPHEHEGLMLGKEGKFVKTYQWSQRPHLSSVAYYKDIIIPTMPGKTFIEDGYHGVVQNDWNRNGMMGWFKHRLWIYHPNNKNIKRSYTTDGRQGGLKYTSDDKVGL